MISKSLFSFASLMLLMSSPSYALPQYAEQTHRECSYCHIDPSGGGMLTINGMGFAAAKFKQSLSVYSFPKRVVVTGVRFIHLFFAIMWFGTILYVHILLKPAYASKGLPRAELRLGWLSIGIMAVTGLYLTYHRLGSFAELTTTRFGVLLTIKVALYLVMVATATLVTFVLGPRMKRKLAAPAPSGPLSGPMTIEQASQCDGSEGRPAYVVYKGVVYDVTASRLWKDGVHLRRHHAGHDLSEDIGLAPHTEVKILAMPKAGFIVEGKSAQTGDRPRKVFYVMAYSNLVLVVAIIFIVTLFRS